MSIVIGVDPGKRMGVVGVLSIPQPQAAPRLYVYSADLYKGIDAAILTDIKRRMKRRAEDPSPDFSGCTGCTVWIEEPDGHVMSARIGLRQTKQGIRQSAYHHTNVHAIFSLGVVAGKVAGICEELGIPHHFITASEVKRLVTGDPVISKANLALYLESKGYALPRLRSGKPDPELVDALAIALAGAKKMEAEDGS